MGVFFLLKYTLVSKIIVVKVEATKKFVLEMNDERKKFVHIRSKLGLEVYRVL